MSKLTRSEKSPASLSGSAADARSARLKAALKANIAKRKDQARARSQAGDTAMPSNQGNKAGQ